MLCPYTYNVLKILKKMANWFNFHILAIPNSPHCISLCNTNTHTHTQTDHAHTFETRSQSLFLSLRLLGTRRRRCTPLLIIPSNCITKSTEGALSANVIPQFVSPKAKYGSVARVSRPISQTFLNDPYTHTYTDAEFASALSAKKTNPNNA